MNKQKDKFEEAVYFERYAEAVSIFHDCGDESYVRMLLGRIEELEDQVRYSEKELSSYKTEASDLQEEADEKYAKICSLESDLDSANDEIGDLKVEINSAESRIEDLENEIGDLKSEFESYKQDYPEE